MALAAPPSHPVPSQQPAAQQAEFQRRPKAASAAKPASARRSTSPNALDVLTIYNGDWAVRASHPWSGAKPGSVDRLQSRCRRYTLYAACEQTVNGKPQALIVYTIGAAPGRFNTRTIAPNGLAGGRGDLIISGDHWTYLDKPAAGLTGPWSRVENFISDRNTIRFEEYESADEGKSWTQTNSGVERRSSRNAADAASLT